MSKWKKMLGILIAGALLITSGILPHEKAATAAEGNYGISNPRIENGVTTWDKIKFGSYYQDAEIQPAEPIKWRVLSVDGDDAFLLADQNLDAKPYNEEKEDVTWETCTLRKWLNDDFYNEAFNAEEQNAIKETSVVNNINPQYGTEGGSTTTDKVYLLSIEEASKSVYGFEPTFDEKSKTKEAKNTDYAKLNNASSNGSTYVGNGTWWLRSPGFRSDSSTFISSDGSGDDRGMPVNFINYCVRPALHINLSSSQVKDAGEVDSDGNVTKSDDDIKAPRIEDGVTTWDCVYFGSYKQNVTFNKQDIEWRVLSVDGDDAFLLAERNLDAKPYNEKAIGVTWETCPLRKWLNSDFYNEAFNEEEKKAIKETEVINNYRPEYETNTTDKVYLLSIKEAFRAMYGFDTTFTVASKTRETKNTDYARVNNAYAYMLDSGTWWLRSVGTSRLYAICVSGSGGGDSQGNYVTYCHGVRPALHINLSSSSWSKVGDVATATPTPTPTVEPTPTPTPTPTPIQIKEDTVFSEDITISENTVYERDVYIKQGATVKIEEGCEVTFSKAVYVWGTLENHGTILGGSFIANTSTQTPTPTTTPTVEPSPITTPTPTVSPQPSGSATLPTESPDGTASPVVTPTVTPTQTPPTASPSSRVPAEEIKSPTTTEQTALKTLKLSAVKCKKNTKRVTGKVSVSKATVKIKVGKKAYKKAKVMGKKFTLKLNYKLKKRTKIKIQMTKKGYKKLTKTYKVK